MSTETGEVHALFIEAKNFADVPIGKLWATTERSSGSTGITNVDFGRDLEITYQHLNEGPYVISPLIAGDPVEKIGRSTGWTTGTVFTTCADVKNTNTGIVYLCQTLADLGSQKGDSGAPVFWLTGPNGEWPINGSDFPNSNTATLHGIGFGRVLWSNTAYYAFSEARNIELDFGQIQTYN